MLFVNKENIRKEIVYKAYHRPNNSLGQTPVFQKEVYKSPYICYNKHISPLRPLN